MAKGIKGKCGRKRKKRQKAKEDGKGEDKECYGEEEKEG